MPEQQPHPPPVERDTLAAALHTKRTTTTDSAGGRGWRYEVADGRLSVDVFPHTGLTRLTTPAAQLELAGPLTVQTGTDKVVFTQQTPTDAVHAEVSPNGTLIFSYIAAPPPPPERPATPPERPPQPSSAPPAGEGPAPTATAPAAAHRPAPAPASPAPPATRAEQAPRVQLTGRLGRDPHFRTTTNTGTRIARFPLAVHTEDGTTRWHTVLAFGARAEQLQRRTQAGELAQGREVDVVGYLHTTTRPGRDGKPRTVQEIYAVAVTKR